MSLSAHTSLPVEEVLHGVTVIDPYRWLEDRDSPETGDWIASQKKRLDAYFSNSEESSALRARVGHFLNVDAIDQAAHVGNLCFYRRRERNREQGRIWVKDMATAQERVLFDPNKQGRFVSAGIHCISDDGSLLAYELKYGGADTKAIHIVQVESGRALMEHLDTGYARGFAFATGNSGFYYCHEPSGATGDHTIRLRQFAQGTEQDQVVLRMTRTLRSRLVLMSDEFRLGAVYIHDHGSDVSTDFYLASRNHDQQWTRVFSNRRLPCAPFLSHKRILMLTQDGAPNGRIVELSEKGIVSHLIVPETEARIQQVSVAGENIYISYVIRGETIVRVYLLSGQYLGSLSGPRNGSIKLFAGYGNRSDTLFYSYESFTEPATIFQCHPETGNSEIWARTSISLDGTRYHIRRITYLSKDATEIPMTLVTLKDMESANERPAILTSYGGFGLSMTPQFSVLVEIMLELGAVFAVPNIRGGSEFGTAWHEAARRRKRQVAVDDFISAAEWLCEQHVTNPHKLAIFGGSNSGLLVGAALTQRPDLFRAAICIAPLLDMLRFEQFGQARKWEAEYGTVTESADFLALYAYSPYHHVDNDVNYPSTLFVAGDRDERCDPAHVRKMAARLQDRIAQQSSILVDYSRERGHSPVLPLSVRIEALTRRIAFLCRELNIRLPSEGSE